MKEETTPEYIGICIYCEEAPITHEKEQLCNSCFSDLYDEDYSDSLTNMEGI